jgi:3-dehydroquinate dehydratase/shikimate dehydrogenase
MGEYGHISRILGGKFGGMLTFGSAEENLSTALGQLTLTDLNTIFRVPRIDRHTKIFGLVGNPVKHSRGIYYHNSRFRQQACNAVYVNFLVDQIENFIEHFRDRITGLSVTMPFKGNVIPYLDSVDDQARIINSVNTIIKRKQRLKGYNTDFPAITHLLRESTSVKNKKVIVLGTGATANTMARAAVTNGARVTILGRSLKKAKTIADKFSCQHGRIADISAFEADIIMNGTPVGTGRKPSDDMHPSSLVPKKMLKKGMIVFDAVYEPAMTPLLRDAKTSGCSIITGVEFFEHQAKLQSKYFMDALS